MGPSAIRYAGLDERLRCDRLRRARLGQRRDGRARGDRAPDERARYLPEIKAACGRVARLVGLALEQERVPLVLGGDHSVAMGTLGGLARPWRGGVLWIDAHGDLNTPETSPSGNVHGMPLAAALGLGDERFDERRLALPAVDPERVALIGLRSLDPGERERIRELGIGVTP